MKEKIYRTGILFGMTALLFVGVLGQEPGNTYAVKASFMDDAGLNGKEALAANVSEIMATEAEALKAKIPEEEEAKEELPAEAAKTERQKDAEKLGTHFGSYRVTGFYPVWSRGGREFFDVRPQEADLLIGRIIDIQPDRLTTYDMGDREFTNYIMKRYVIENPQYIWDDPESGGIVKGKGPLLSMIEEDLEDVGEGYYEQLEGFITILLPEVSKGADHWFYTFEDKDKMVMRSNVMSGGVFLLERCEEKPEEPLPEWTDREIRELLQGVYGEYRVTEFLPTKFYPAWDYTTLEGKKTERSFAILPEEEAGLMIGKTITISEDLFVTYDNYRMPMSELAKRLRDDFWVKRIEMGNPDYRVKSMRAEEIYGIRDGMLTGDLAQQAYVEIDVYPGYETNEEPNLPQMYLTNDGRILLYAMGEYFLLERLDSREGTASGHEADLSAWIGKYTGSSSVNVWVGDPFSGHSEDQPREYEIEIRANDSGGYDADITIDSEVWDTSVKIRASVQGNDERISFVFKEYISGELIWSELQSDVLLGFRKDAGTGEIYTHWGGLNVDKETPEEICFVKR